MMCPEWETYFLLYQKMRAKLNVGVVIELQVYVWGEGERERRGGGRGTDRELSKLFFFHHHSTGLYIAVSNCKS